MELDEKYKFLTSDHFLVSHIGDASAGDQTLVAEKGGLVFVFNFSPSTDLEGFKVRRGELGVNWGGGVWHLCVCCVFRGKFICMYE